MNGTYTAKYIAELLAEHKEYVKVGNRLYAEAPVYDFAEIIEQQMARIKELETALRAIEHDARLSSDPQRAHSCQISFDELLSGYGAIADQAKAALEGGDA